METSTNNLPLKVESNNVSEKSSRKSGKDEKSRRKDDKSVDQVMKALNNMETADEKLTAMCKKYADVLDENRKLQVAAKQWEKGLNVVQREKEQLQTDHSKAVLTRSRLESLCRELQRQNKAVKEESLLKVREEEEKRKEVSAKFNATLAEITSLMSSSNEKTNKLRDENVDITKKFRSICEQSGLQQQQVDKMHMQRKLEAELSEAKMTKQKLEFAAEKEILLRDKQQLLLDLQEARGRSKDMQVNEVNLKSQVALYADRYEEFQNALSRSNEVFGGFKGEMDKMSKKIVKLEKEALSWKSRWEKSHNALLEMASDKQQRDAELALANRQLVQLQKLCRTLQTERVGLLAQIKGLDNNTLADSVQETLSNATEDPALTEALDILMEPIKVSEPTPLPEDTPVIDVKTKGGNPKSNKKAKLNSESKLKHVTKPAKPAADPALEPIANQVLNNLNDQPKDPTKLGDVKVVDKVPVAVVETPVVEEAKEELLSQLPLIVKQSEKEVITVKPQDNAVKPVVIETQPLPTEETKLSVEPAAKVDVEPIVAAVSTKTIKPAETNVLPAVEPETLQSENKASQPSTPVQAQPAKPLVSETKKGKEGAKKRKK